MASSGNHSGIGRRSDKYGDVVPSCALGAQHCAWILDYSAPEILILESEQLEVT
jgi:hypothetical protein